MRYNIWHNTNGIADQYFVCKGDKVMFQIPKWIGRLLYINKN